MRDFFINARRGIEFLYLSIFGHFLKVAMRRSRRGGSRTAPTAENQSKSMDEILSHKDDKFSKKFEACLQAGRDNQNQSR